jgi:hypothetical protein
LQIDFILSFWGFALFLENCASSSSFGEFGNEPIYFTDAKEIGKQLSAERRYVNSKTLHTSLMYESYFHLRANLQLLQQKRI